MLEEENRDCGRRQVMKRVGAVLVAGSIAGCSGGDSDDPSGSPQRTSRGGTDDADSEGGTTSTADNNYTVADVSSFLPDIENPMQAVPQKDIMQGPEGAWPNKDAPLVLTIFRNAWLRRDEEEWEEYRDEAGDMLELSYELLREDAEEFGKHPLLSMEDIGVENVILGNEFDSYLDVFFLDPYIDLSDEVYDGTFTAEHTQEEISNMEDLDRRKALNTAYKEIFEELSKTEDYKWDGVLTDPEIPVQLFRGQGTAEPFTVGLLDNTNVMVKVNEPDAYSREPENQREETLRDINVNNALERISDQLKGYEEGEFRGPNPVNRANANPATGNDPFDNLSEANTVLAEWMMKAEWGKIPEHYFGDDPFFNYDIREEGEAQRDENGFPVKAKEPNGFDEVRTKLYLDVDYPNEVSEIETAAWGSINVLIRGDLNKNGQIKNSRVYQNFAYGHSYGEPGAYFPF